MTLFTCSLKSKWAIRYKQELTPSILKTSGIILLLPILCHKFGATSQSVKLRKVKSSMVPTMLKYIQRRDD